MCHTDWDGELQTKITKLTRDQSTFKKIGNQAVQNCFSKEANKASFQCEQIFLADVQTWPQDTRHNRQLLLLPYSWPPFVFTYEHWRCEVQTGFRLLDLSVSNCHRQFFILLLRNFFGYQRLASLIHSFIQAISKAPLPVHYYSEALQTQHGYCVGVSLRSTTGNYEWRTCPR